MDNWIESDVEGDGDGDGDGDWDWIGKELTEEGKGDE